jgi:hypothetical protein
MFMMLVPSAFERNEHGEPPRDTVSFLPSGCSVVRVHVRICEPEHLPTGASQWVGLRSLKDFWVQPD